MATQELTYMSTFTDGSSSYTREPGRSVRRSPRLRRIVDESEEEDGVDEGGMGSVNKEGADDVDGSTDSASSMTDPVDNSVTENNRFGTLTTPYDE